MFKGIILPTFSLGIRPGDKVVHHEGWGYFWAPPTSGAVLKGKRCPSKDFFLDSSYYYNCTYFIFKIAKNLAFMFNTMHPYTDVRAGL